VTSRAEEDALLGLLHNGTEILLVSSPECFKTLFELTDVEAEMGPEVDRKRGAVDRDKLQERPLVQRWRVQVGLRGPNGMLDERG